MRFAVGLVLALAMAAPCAAGTFQLDTPPPAAVPPLDPGAQVAAVSFARIAAQLPDGLAFADVRGGDMGCLLPGRPLHWRSSMNEFSDPDFERIFRAEFAKGGLKVSGDQTNLFEAAPTPTDLQVGALVTDFKARLCVPGLGPGVTGAALMGVEWQVYSTTAGKVIARIPTQGGAPRARKSDVGETLGALFQLSFAENVRQLEASPQFRKIVLDPRLTPTAEAQERGPLRIAFRTDAKPVALKEATNGAVTIFAGDAMGSGVLISADGYILTNHHVAGTAGQVRIRWPDGSESIGQVLRGDRRRDVALIKVALPRGRPLAIRRAPVELGETVYAIGTPLRDELQNTLTRGIVSGMRTMDGESFIQSDTPITHGNSGGPLLDDKGAVVGLSDLGTDPSLGSTINFFIPIDDALKVLALQPAS